jgi:hypothetical protein
MTKVGNRELIFNATIFIPSEEEAEVEIIVAENDHMSLAFAFKEEPESDGGDKRKPFLTLSGEGDIGKITFVNWTETFGSSITSPYNIATSNSGEPISFLGSAIKIGAMYKLEFQIMKGVKK